MPRSLVRGVVAALLSLALPLGAFAQETAGVLAGRVTDKATGGPLDRALVTAIPAAGRPASTYTDATGAYRIALGAGRYTISVRRVGHRDERLAGVDVSAGATRTLDVALVDLPTRLTAVVSTAGHGSGAEKNQNVPADVSVVQEGEIAQRPSVTVTDHLKALPGLSVSTGGIAQANIVSRGFNNAFSTQMLMLQDYRFAGVPSLRVNVPFLFTGTNEDIESIEVLQGPAAALYGPNSGNGALHVITKSPFNSAGTTITMDGGERSLGRGSLRHAGILPGGRFAYKLSGEYVTAKDFRYDDPNEPAAWSSVDPRVPAERRGKAAQRDFDVQKVSGEARVDFRPGANTELISTAGYSRIGSGLEITTTFGAAQVRDWSYLSLQERFRHKRFFAQVFYNASDAGNKDASDPRGTYYLRSGIPVVDQSNVLVGQLQQVLNLGRTRFVLGGDYIATRPKTAGTIDGRNENDDAIDEYGAYLQGTTPITSILDFVAAARGDMNSRIEGSQFSPSAALLLKPTDRHTLRLTFTRSFNSPAPFSFFLDQYSGSTPAPGMPVQIMGNPPKSGWTFARSCTGGAAGNLCMRSPYVATTPGTLPGASAAAAYPGFVLALPQIVQGLPVSSFGSAGEAGRQQLLGLLQQLGPILRAGRPTDAQVGTVLMDLGTKRPAAGVNDYAPLGANFSNTWEAGYKGSLGDRVALSFDAWFQRRPADPTTQILNPGVLFNPQHLGAYLGASITQGLIASGMPAAQAQATAAAAAGALTPLMAAIPVGATAFTSANYTQPYLVVSYQNGTGYVNVHGFDVAADISLSSQWSLAATYSNLSRNVFADAPGASEANPLAANTPKHRATATFRFTPNSNVSAEVRGRYADAFPVNSGVFNSYDINTPVRYAPVPVNALLDAGFSWRLPLDPNVRWSLNATNLLDNKVPTFVGVPAIGRLVMTRVSYVF